MWAIIFPNLHPYQKRSRKIVDGAVTELKFYLADVEAFVAPLVVIANIGGKPNDYFCQNRLEWKEDFEDWLETPNEDLHLMPSMTKRMTATIVRTRLTLM
jgi:hypothetical protein